MTDIWGEAEWIWHSSIHLTEDINVCMCVVFSWPSWFSTQIAAKSSGSPVGTSPSCIQQSSLKTASTMTVMTFENLLSGWFRYVLLWVNTLVFLGEMGHAVGNGGLLHTTECSVSQLIRWAISSDGLSWQCVAHSLDLYLVDKLFWSNSMAEITEHQLSTREEVQKKTKWEHMI